MSDHCPYKIPQSVLVVIHTPALEVLLIRRADGSEHWQSVTGAKDSEDEPFDRTAAREVFEETGIDAATGTIATTVPLEGDPRGPVLSGDARTLYVLDKGKPNNNPDKNQNGRLHAVSMSTRTVSVSDAGSRPRGLILDEDRQQLLLLSDGAPVKGPANLFEQLKTRFDEPAPVFRHVETQDVDLTVEFGETVLVTRMAAWADTVRKVLA